MKNYTNFLSDLKLYNIGKINAVIKALRKTVGSSASNDVFHFGKAKSEASDLAAKAAAKGQDPEAIAKKVLEDCRPKKGEKKVFHMVTPDSADYQRISSNPINLGAKPKPEPAKPMTAKERVNAEFNRLCRPASVCANWGKISTK